MGETIPIVKMDEKGRIQLPHKVREAWHLKPRQPLVVDVRRESISIRRAQADDPGGDPVLRDMLLRPGRSRVRLTKRVLRRLKDEAWQP